MNKVVMLVLLCSLLVLSSCSVWQTGGGNPEVDRYYQGTQGVLMRFVPGSPPANGYYYSGGSADENSFLVSVELKNEGASDAMGALYISGYDPDLLSFRNVDIQKRSWSDCTFDIGFPGSHSSFGFVFDCPGADGRYSENGWSLRLEEVGRWLNEQLNTDDFDWLEDVSISVEDGTLGSISLGTAFGSADILNHGRALSLVLSAIDFRNFNGFPFNGGVEKEGPGILRGDNYYYPGGDFGFQNFEGVFNSYWPYGRDEMDVDFLVTACYGYATYAAPTICIDPAPYDQSRKVCTPKTQISLGSQGGPVAITEIRQESTPKKVYLTFTVRNVGTGRVFNMGYLERCSPYYSGILDSRHLDSVYVADVRIGSQQLDCSSRRDVRLQNGIGTFSCSYDVEYATVKSAYPTNVVVELWYGYQETMQTRMHVKRVE